MYCPQCGHNATEDARFCQSCGTTLTDPGPPPEPITIKGITYTPGTGKYAGYYSGPSGWVTINDFLVKRARPDRNPPSTGRVIAAIVCFIVAALAGIQAVSWFMGFAELDAEGNPFAGLLAPLALGATAVAAGFGVAGGVLISGSKKNL